MKEFSYPEFLCNYILVCKTETNPNPNTQYLNMLDMVWKNIHCYSVKLQQVSVSELPIEAVVDETLKTSLVQNSIAFWKGQNTRRLQQQHETPCASRQQNAHRQQQQGITLGVRRN